MTGLLLAAAVLVLDVLSILDVFNSGKDAEKKAIWPVFVRVLGTNGQGEPGLKDAEGNEILEWEPGRAPAEGAEPPKVIVDAPPAHAPGFLDRPANLKVS